jgi:hypothetical protein
MASRKPAAKTAKKAKPTTAKPVATKPAVPEFAHDALAQVPHQRRRDRRRAAQGGEA